MHICFYPTPPPPPSMSRQIVFFKENISFIDYWVILRQRGTKFWILSPVLSGFDQILLNVLTNKKQKWAKFFHLTLNGSWDISFWNLHNFRAFFSEIHHFKFSIFNKIVITWVLWGQSSWKLAPLYFFRWGIQKSH